MTNPFPIQEGFELRVYYAIHSIKRLGRDPHSKKAYDEVFNNRAFDNCFENHDGEAVVYAIMETVFEKNDAVLLKGVKAMGNNVFRDWNNNYQQVKRQQLSFF